LPLGEGARHRQTEGKNKGVAILMFGTPLYRALAVVEIGWGDPVKRMAMHGLDAAGIQALIEKRFPSQAEQAQFALKVVA
jgi:hypothetical protein